MIRLQVVIFQFIKVFLDFTGNNLTSFLYLILKSSNKVHNRLTVDRQLLILINHYEKNLLI